jgi:hypothetical protein
MEQMYFRSSLCVALCFASALELPNFFKHCVHCMLLSGRISTTLAFDVLIVVVQLFRICSFALFALVDNLTLE